MQYPNIHISIWKNNILHIYVYIYTCSLGIDTYVFLFFFECHPPQKRTEISGTGTFWPITSHWENLVEVDIQFIPMMPFVGHHIPRQKTLATAMFEAWTKKRGHSIAVFVMLPASIMVWPPQTHKKTQPAATVWVVHVLGRLPFSPAFCQWPCAAHLAEVSGSADPADIGMTYWRPPFCKLWL